MSKKQRMITLRVPDWVARDADELAEYERRPRSQLLRETLEEGLRGRKLDRTLERYGKGEISLGRAAAEAGVTVFDIIDEGHRRNLPPQYTMKEWEEDLAAVKRWGSKSRRSSG
ncbi:MAG TPA: UPF0175 family protein [Thermoplasmata archaeon]|nr:UPF0175 family protein [Thermoplasmata archaeon]